MAFLCEVDLGGQKVPATWSVALKILQKNYANSVVISALADVKHYKIIIITVHGVNCVVCILMFQVVCFIALISEKEIKHTRNKSNKRTTVNASV